MSKWRATPRGEVKWKACVIPNLQWKTELTTYVVFSRTHCWRHWAWGCPAFFQLWSCLYFWPWCFSLDLSSCKHSVAFGRCMLVRNFPFSFKSFYRRFPLYLSLNKSKCCFRIIDKTPLRILGSNTTHRCKMLKFLKQ